MSDLRIEQIHSASRAFAAYHGLSLPAPGSVHRLGEERGSGSFGAVFALDDPGGGAAVMVKVFDEREFPPPGGTGVLVERLEDLHRVLEQSAEQDWQRILLALPFCLAQATLSGERRTVALMLDLESQGYRPSPFANREEQDRYRTREPSERVEFALDFAIAAALLERIGFVHGDLNPENLMFDLARGRVQIIDLDSGVVAKTGSERPLTAGKLGDCMPPEVKGAGLESLFDIARYTAAAERWSVGSLVGRLLFGIHPGFFLRALGSQTLSAYAKLGSRWPEIDTAGPLFTKEKGNRSAYPAFRSLFEAAPGDTRGLFGRFFAAGLDGSRRPSAVEWAEGLEEVRRPPELEFLRVSPQLVVEGDEVVLSWAASNAERVESPDFGTAEPVGSRRLVVGQTRNFRLTAVNAYGEQERTSASVRAVAAPRITGIPAASFPGLHLDARISTTIPPPQPRGYSPRPPLEALSVKPAPRLPLGRLVPMRQQPQLPWFSNWLLNSVDAQGRKKGGGHGKNDAVVGGR